jgi:hypothetical protein
MKSLLITVLLLGGAFLAYDRFLAPPGSKVVFTELNPPKKPQAADTPAVAETKSEEPASAEPAPQPETPKMAEAAPSAAPAPAAVAAPVQSAAPKAGSIEALTNNWTVIPPSAFKEPREVTLKKDAEFKMAAGASKVVAGRKVFAIGFKDGMLALIPAPGATARAIVPIDDTDLKAVLTDGYERWKVARAAYLAEVAAKKKTMAPVNTSDSNVNRTEADDAGRPVRSSDGTYPLLIASMRRGQVTDIKPERIVSWGEPMVTQMQGKTGYAIKVSYNADTIFGPQQVDAQALVVNGQVQGWFYVGSGEEVP